MKNQSLVIREILRYDSAMNKFIPYGKQWIDESDKKAVLSVLKNDFLTCGPKIEEFENALCKVTGAKY